MSQTTTSRTLRLTLKRRWFDMIACGIKLHEYRTPGKWILSRLGKPYDRIEFKNGYGPKVPTMEVEFLGWAYGHGQAEWGAGPDKLIVISLGRILSLRNFSGIPDFLDGRAEQRRQCLGRMRDAHACRSPKSHKDYADAVNELSLLYASGHSLEDYEAAVNACLRVDNMHPWGCKKDLNPIR